MAAQLRFQAVLFSAILLAWLVVREGLRGVENNWGEPLALRWLRKAAEHPIRTPLALFFIASSFAPRRARGTDSDPNRKRNSAADRNAHPPPRAESAV